MIKEVIRNKLYVSDDGKIYDDLNGKSERKICYSSCGRERDRGTVSLQIDGKQKNFYVNRLVAEAFIKNPENKPVVRYIDGDTKNNNVSNLEWVTQKELVSFMQEDGRYFANRNVPSCLICAEPTYNKDEICPICKKELKKEENEHLRKAKIRDSLGQIDLDELNDSERETVNLRLQYYTYEEIAKIKGVTRQCVEQQISNSVKKTVFKKVHKKDEKLIIKTMQEINKKKAQLENIKIEMDVIKTEIEELENALETFKDRKLA